MTSYAVITQDALDYMDRSDTKTISKIDSFIRTVESYVNKKLQVSDQSVRTRISIPADSGREYVGLPSDFGGMRQLTVIGDDGNLTVTPLNPELVELHKLYNYENPGYQIIANKQLHIVPSQEGKTIEMVYYQKVPNLNSTDTTNWLLTMHQEVYLFGLCAEIAAFTKDATAFGIWRGRFESAVEDIIVDDAMDRWSGPPLSIGAV